MTAEHEETESEVWICSFGKCLKEAAGFAPNGFLVCASHAQRLGIRLVPVQRSGS